MKKYKNIAALIITVLLISLYAVINNNTNIYKMTVNNVSGTGIGAGFIDDTKYETVIKNEHIKYENDTPYVFLIKQKKTFWYTSNYIEKAEIDILANDGGKCAVVFVNKNYNLSDRLLTKSAKTPREGEDVYLDKN